MLYKIIRGFYTLIHNIIYKKDELHLLFEFEHTFIQKNLKNYAKSLRISYLDFLIFCDNNHSKQNLFTKSNFIIL